MWSVNVTPGTVLCHTLRGQNIYPRSQSFHIRTVKRLFLNNKHCLLAGCSTLKNATLKSGLDLQDENQYSQICKTAQQKSGGDMVVSVLCGLLVPLLVLAVFVFISLWRGNIVALVVMEIVSG